MNFSFLYFKLIIVEERSDTCQWSIIIICLYLVILILTYGKSTVCDRQTTEAFSHFYSLGERESNAARDDHDLNAVFPRSLVISTSRLSYTPILNMYVGVPHEVKLCLISSVHHQAAAVLCR